MFIKIYLNYVDIKHCINKNKYIIYSRLEHNLLKTYRIPLKVEMNAKMVLVSIK